MKTITVEQSKLTAECWLVQFWGRSACKTCEFRGTEDCGGRQIRKTGKNSQGIRVPVSSVKEDQ